ncbi:MAG: hypothetical protein KAR42_13625 [candidate division Zixibacteria bacterium]|nr:hypothetical protein [candidate division Zixibacteria bacterium]
MYKVYIAIIGTILMAFSGSVCGESLVIVSEIELTVPNAPLIDTSEWPVSISGCHVNGDTILVSTDVGLLIRYPKSELWTELIDWSAGDDKYIGYYYSEMRKGNSQYYPGYIMKMAEDNKYAIFQSLSWTPYEYDLQPDEVVSVKSHKLDDFYTHFCDIGIGQNIITYAISSGDHDSIIGISNADFSDYRRVYQIPNMLKSFLDSVDASTNCHPTFNPHDSTIWFAMSSNDKIYKIDIAGNLLDSIHLDDDEFHLPQPPLSRLKSQAVFQDWLSKCTEVSRLAYVNSGHLILQYLVRELDSKQKMAIVKYSPTLAWRIDKTPIDLQIDKNWQLVQVQPDGTIIFVEYSKSPDEESKAVLHIVRIES